MYLLRSVWILLLASFSLPAASTIDPGHRFAYAANVGWVDWRGDGANGAVIGQYVCAGQIYAANAGWINLGNGAPRNGVRYGNQLAGDFGVNHDGAGNLQGFAWGANIGWICFTNRTTTGAPFAGPRVDLLTGRLSGFVWSGNIGWISLSNAVAYVQTTTIPPGEDTDADGIPDAWELEHFNDLSTASATSDTDSDGVSDRDEFLAGFDPRQASSKLQLAPPALSPASGFLSLTWPSRPGRQYRILAAESLSPRDFWTDIGLGWINPDEGATTTRPLPPATTKLQFFRVETSNPLWP